MGVVTFQTETGSIYIVDLSEKTLRKLNGTGDAPATERIASGRRFANITDIIVGRRVVIFWGIDTPLLEGSPADATPITTTSRVVEVHR